MALPRINVCTSCVPSYIVPVGVVGGGTSANAFVFNAMFTVQPGTLPASPAVYSSARFNASRRLYVLDTDYDQSTENTVVFARLT